MSTETKTVSTGFRMDAYDVTIWSAVFVNFFATTWAMGITSLVQSNFQE